MSSTYEIILETADRKLAWDSRVHRWRFVRDEKGIRAEVWLDRNRAIAEELAEIDAAFPEIDPAMAAYFEGMEEPEPRFPTLELAKEYAAILDAEESIEGDLRAFRAPAECRPLARCRDLEERREALLKLAVK